MRVSTVLTRDDSKTKVNETRKDKQTRDYNTLPRPSCVKIIFEDVKTGLVFKNIDQILLLKKALVFVGGF
jgi:hypothetical protein